MVSKVGGAAIVFFLLFIATIFGFLLPSSKYFLTEGEQITASLSDNNSTCSVKAIGIRYHDKYDLQYGHGNSNYSWIQSIPTDYINPTDLCIGSNITCWSNDFENGRVVVMKIYKHNVPSIIALAGSLVACILSLITLIVLLYSCFKGEKVRNDYNQL